MKNEEKAKELADYYAGETDYKETAAYDAALAMAEWKDERIKELEVTLKCRSKYERIYRDEFLKAEKEALINKACEWLRNNIESDKYLSPDEESYRMGCGVDYLETNMFIEDFKKAMKGE